MARSIKIAILTPDNKGANISVSNINTATGTTTEVILTFARGIVDLTENTYLSTTDETSNKLD